MATNNAGNQIFTNNADGWDLSGGTVVRKYTQSGGDVAVVAGGSNTYIFPSAADTLLGRVSVDTVTNKRITKRSLATSANSATPTINTDLYDVVIITGQTNNITSFTTNLTGTPVEGDTLIIAATAGSGTPTLVFGALFEASTIPLPTGLTTTRQDFAFRWNTATAKWRCVGVV